MRSVSRCRSVARRDIRTERDEQDAGGQPDGQRLIEQRNGENADDDRHQREKGCGPFGAEQGDGFEGFFPVGGAANGTPRKAVIRGSAASIPRTRPFSVFVCRIIDLLLSKTL